MLNINNKYSNIIINSKNSQNIKDGDIVRYSLMRKLDNNKAIINIMGNKVVALFKDGMQDKGFAVINKENGKIVLKLLKDVNSLKEAREAISNNAIKDTLVLHSNKENNTEISSILLKNSIKQSTENITYLERIIKYIPQLDDKKMKFILNSMSNGIYFSIDELEMFENIFSKFNNLHSIIKNSNKNIEKTEILLTLLKEINDTDKSLKNYISSNGNLNIWFMLFDMLQDELSSDSSNMLNLLLKILSSNRKNKTFREGSFLIPIPFMVNNELKEVLLYINRKDNKAKNLEFIAYDNNKELCKIEIVKENKYIINLVLFDKKLFLKCNSIKTNIDKELEKFNNIELEINYEKRN
ncbi:hypothetical protein [Brachyspira pilosicoli]|uniref:hypothetical protein n=1 Tax=Brachyspira pilosicoli TaxID=52584 RepID=UPI001CA5EE9D|nr:hypothetical protein [Brachyspira pilosicoli]MBW5396487.1 hypothetical protein [Brachyspira pilosicoli]